MKLLRSMIRQALVLGLTIMLFAPTAFLDVSCIDECSAQLARCTNSGTGTENCEDQFDACIEGCIGDRY